MMKCPICETVVDEKYDYCRKCAWEFEYYFDELEESEQKRYDYRLSIQKNIYSQYLFLNDENQKLLKEIEQLKKHKTVEYETIPNLFKDKKFLEPQMVLIKRDSFIMGSNDEYDNEKPPHKVTIDYDFEIGKYEVTFEEYDYFCDETGRKKPNDMGWGRGKRPVINVSWNDAKAYTKWLSKKTDKNYRLPTEAEWEFVARAEPITKWSFKNKSTKWCFGNTESKLKDYAWYSYNNNGKTHKVGTKKPNQWGVYDMHGNVWEWCEDWYLDSYKNTPRDGSANHSQNKNLKVLRGGSWYDLASITRSANRNGGYPALRINIGGFRLQRTLP